MPERHCLDVAACLPTSSTVLICSSFFCISDVNRVPVNRITGYVTRGRFQLTVTDTRKSNCDLRHLVVGRDTSVDRKQIMIKSVHRSRCRRLMSIKVPVVTAPNLQQALSTDAALGLPLPRPTRCLTPALAPANRHV